ncbi:hypothetical protein [Faecalibacter macacae]|uniref:Uncharacterized protein n=1 Tax=Faecalibacter macacae TaxID=1859289 RepID=A0A3L9MH42_9FLAO|nr:hypothetical protein [Faecalibacter macacae]RLZ10644.1 hypothetical protein EAH69_05735 [Faecalibacter macacae]
MPHEFSIYTPKEKSLFTDINLKPLAFLGLVFSLFILNELIDLPQEEKFRTILLNSLWITVALVGFYYYSLMRIDVMITEDQLTKKLKFHPNYIQIDTTIIPLDTIKSINFILKDFKINPIEDLILRKRNPYKNLSIGIGNYLTIELKNLESQKIQFQRISEKELLKVKDELIHYYQKGKISLLNVTEALHITKYEDIQQFIEDYPTKNVN